MDHQDIAEYDLAYPGITRKRIRPREIRVKVVIIAHQLNLINTKPIQIFIFSMKHKFFIS